VRLAPVPKVAGGTTIGGLVAYGMEVLVDYGWDIKPSLAAWVVLLTTFTVAWLIPGGDGPLHGLPPYPRRSFPDADPIAVEQPEEEPEAPRSRRKRIQPRRPTAVPDEAA
jgi:hypothetical protein